MLFISSLPQCVKRLQLLSSWCLPGGIWQDLLSWLVIGILDAPQNPMGLWTLNVWSSPLPPLPWYLMYSFHLHARVSPSAVYWACVTDDQCQWETWISSGTGPSCDTGTAEAMLGGQGTAVMEPLDMAARAQGQYKDILILLSTLTSVASDLFNYSAGRHGL